MSNHKASIVEEEARELEDEILRTIDKDKAQSRNKKNSELTTSLMKSDQEFDKELMELERGNDITTADTQKVANYVEADIENVLDQGSLTNIHCASDADLTGNNNKEALKPIRLPESRDTTLTPPLEKIQIAPLN